jgi:hypothetical protein
LNEKPTEDVVLTELLEYWLWRRHQRRGKNNRKSWLSRYCLRNDWNRSFGGVVGIAEKAELAGTKNTREAK